MKFLKIILPLYLLTVMASSTLLMGGTTYKYVPIIVDDMNIMVPYAVTSTSTYTPPANSLGHTTITTTTGKKIRVDKIPSGFVFEGYVGKIVLLEVYGDTCPHCMAAIPSYNALQAKYSKDVVIIALESYGTLNNASQQHYITIAKTKTGSMFSYIESLTGYHREAVPYLMIFDRDGDKVYDKILADFPEAEIDGLIQGLL